MFRSFLVLAGITTLAASLAASPASAASSTLTYPTVTFAVPVNISNYPAPPNGVDTLTIFCDVGSGGAALLGRTNRGTIPLTTAANGSRGYVGSITLTATLSPARHSGSPYTCTIGDVNANPFTLGLNAAASTPALKISGELP